MAPSAFVRMIRRIFHLLLYQNLFSYLNDMAVYSVTCEEHLAVLGKFFLRLRKNNLALSILISHLAKQEIKLLQFITTGDEVKPDPRKLEAIEIMPRP